MGMNHPYLPYPTVSVTDQVGWYLDSMLYCLRHEPQAHPIIGIFRGTPEPVLRCEVTYDNVCDVCFEALDEYATDPDSVYDNPDDPMYDHPDSPALEFPPA